MIKKIEVAADKDKKDKRNQVYLGIGLVLLMIVSTVGYSLMNDTENGSSSKKEKGLQFINQNGQWVTNLNGQQIGFNFLPSEVENISVSGIINLQNYYGKPLYLVNIDAGVAQIINVLQPYILRYQEACLDNSTCSNNLPIKGCDNNMIISDSGGIETTKVYMNQNCVYLVGDTSRAADAFLYRMFGIN